MKKAIFYILAMAVLIAGAGGYWFAAKPSAKGMWPEPVLADKSDVKVFAEHVLFDEIDLFHRAQYLFDVHPAINPERVRRRQASYFFRYDEDLAAHGKWFGEINLTEDHREGSLVYLPSDTPYAESDSLSVLISKTDPKAKAFIRIYKSAGESATLAEGQEGFPALTDTRWHRIEIPVSSFVFTQKEVREPRIPDRKSKGMDPYYFLPAVEAKAGKIFAIELGIEGAAAGASLYFDRLSLMRHLPPSRTVAGRVVPQIEGLEIQWNTPSSRHTVLTDAQGQFSFDLPEDVTKIEMLTRHEGAWYLPTVGRYIETATHVPEIVFALDPHHTAPYPAKPSQVFRQTTDYSEIYTPHSFFIIGGTKDNRYGTVEAQANNLGYRDKDHRIENIDDRFRVGILGTCHIDGRQVPSTEHVCTQLEAIANFEGKPLECINLGQGQQTLTGHYSVVKNLTSKMDIDVLYLNTIDPIQFSFLVPERHGNLKNFDINHPNTDYFRFDSENDRLVHIPYDRNYQKHRGNRPQWTPEQIAAHDDRFRAEICRLDKENQSQDVKDTYKAFGGAMRLMQQEAAKSQTQIDIVWPYTQTQDTIVTYNDIKYNPSCFGGLLQETAQQAGMGYHDLRAYIAEKARRLDGTVAFHWAPGGHMSAAAHRFMSEALYGVLSQSNTAYQAWAARYAEASAGNDDDRPLSGNVKKN